MIESLRRHIMMQQAGGGILPAEYQQVEWLQGSGGAYLLLPYYSYEAGAIIRASGSSMQFGAYAGNNVSVQLYYYGNAQNGVRIGNQNILIPAASDIEFNDTTKEVNADGVIYSYSGTALFPGNVGFPLFARYNAGGGGIINTSDSIFRSFSIDGSLISFDLIPCYRKADNEAGMYDIVNAVFYTNSGSGSFVVGPNV